MQSVSCI